jgi:hypothetical protein
MACLEIGCKLLLKKVKVTVFIPQGDVLVLLVEYFDWIVRERRLKRSLITVAANILLLKITLKH